MNSSRKNVKDEQKIEKPDNEESIDNSLLHLSKSLHDINKFFQTSKKEEEVLKNRFKILNLKKSDLEEKIQLTNLDTERMETMNVNLKKTKSIVMEYKKKMEEIATEMKPTTLDKIVDFIEEHMVLLVTSTVLVVGGGAAFVIIRNNRKRVK